jgi:hypothetical protein
MLQGAETMTCFRSLSTTLSLRYDGSKIAHAAIFVMAGESNFKLPLPEGVTFFEFFSIPEAELDGKPCCDPRAVYNMGTGRILVRNHSLPRYLLIAILLLLDFGLSHLVEML